MIVLSKVLLVLLHLICISIDIVVFFLLIRLLFMWRRARLLELFDNTGKALVDAVTAGISRFWYCITQKVLSDKGELVVSLTALSFIRLSIYEIARLL